jgi:nucleotide-binding universal stress UspA family protein
MTQPPNGCRRGRTICPHRASALRQINAAARVKCLHGIEPRGDLMSIKDILLPLTSYPVATATRAIESAVALAGHLGAHVSAMAFELDIQSPIGLYADPVGVRGILAADSKKSAENARAIVHAFVTTAVEGGVAHNHMLVHCPPLDVPTRLVGAARFCDLSMVPLRDGDGGGQEIAERLIFESGRPVLVFPEEPARALPAAIETVAVAWDLSRPSVRAVADAMPLMRRAKEVRFFTVVDDKAIKDAGLGDTLAKHLARHGIEATMEDMRSKGRPIGRVFTDYVGEHEADLLVMGAYGHSRLREFILGGATDNMLTRPPCWVLLSH